MAHKPNERILKDIIFGVQVFTKGQELSEQGNRSDKDKDKQVSLEKDHPKPPSMDLKKAHKDLDVEDPHFLVNTILEELPTNNKFRLSPLAARAALASLVSTAQEDDAADGSKEFGSNVSKKLFMVNGGVSSENPSSTSVGIVTDLVNGEMEVKPSKTARSFEKSSGKKGKKAKVECKTPEVIVSDGTSKRRTTRSARQKSGGSDVSSDCITTQFPAEDISEKGLTARRITRSTIIEVKEEFTVKPQMEDVELIRTTKSTSSKRNRAKQSIVSQEGAIESLKVDKKKIQEQSPINVKKNQQSKGDYAKGTSELPVRVTRSALQNGNFNANVSDDVQMTSEETQTKGLVKTRRSTLLTNLEETEDLVKKQEDLNANMNPAQTEGNGDKRKRSTVTTKKQESQQQVVFSTRVTRSKSKS